MAVDAAVEVRLQEGARGTYVLEGGKVVFGPTTHAEADEYMNQYLDYLSEAPSCPTTVLQRADADDYLEYVDALGCEEVRRAGA